MRGRLLAFVPALMLATWPAAVSAQRAGGSPAGVAHAFYRYHFAHDMAFTRAAVRNRARWLSPDLLVLCRAYFARPSPADEPPEIDGDPFTDSQEYPSSFLVGAATIAGDTALVPVTFFWPAGDRREVTVVLVGAGAWKIADVRYASGSSLSRELAATP